MIDKLSVERILMQAIEQEVHTATLEIGKQKIIIDLESAEAVQILSTTLIELGKQDLALAKTYYSKPVLQYDLYGNFIAEHVSVNAAGRSLGKDKIFPAPAIQKCCAGLLKTAYKYVWRYKK